MLENEESPEKSEQKELKPESAWLGIVQLLKTVGLVLIISVTIRTYFWQPNIVDGASMAPNLHTNDYLGVDKLSYHLHPPERGDIIVFKYPIDPSMNFVKRIIGLPGETVRIENGVVRIINKEHPEGFILDEHSYLSHSVATELVKNPEQHDFPVPENTFFVLGDNRPNSSDSRAWGFLPKDNIEGRAIFRLYPFSEATTFHHPSY